MYVIQKGTHEDQAPGTWWTHAGEASKSVMVKCPRCGKIGGVGLGDGYHHILSTGEVQPSLVCPRLGCDFHEHVTLEGWSDDA